MVAYIHTFKKQDEVHTYEQTLAETLEQAIKSFDETDSDYYHTLIVDVGGCKTINVKDVLARRKEEFEATRPLTVWEIEANRYDDNRRGV